MIVVHSFRSLQETFEARASEWMLTGATLSLAAVFFLNNDMFYKPTFEGLRSILNCQMCWAWILLVVGSVRLAVLIVNGAYWRTPHMRAFTAFLCAGLWFLFCVGFFRNGSVLSAMAPWIFLLDAYNAKRAGKEAGKSEFLQRYMKNRKIVDAGLVPRPQY